MTRWPRMPARWLVGLLCIAIAVSIMAASGAWASLGITGGVSFNPLVFLAVKPLSDIAFLLLVAWACLPDTSRTARQLTLVTAALLPAASLAGMTLWFGIGFSAAWIFGMTYVGHLVWAIVLSAALTTLKKYGMRLRRDVDEQAYGSRPLTLRRLFRIVTVSAVVMALAGLLRADFHSGAEFTSLLGLLLFFLGTISVNVAVLVAPLWCGPPLMRVTLTAGAISGFYLLRTSAELSDGRTTADLAGTALIHSIPMLAVMAVLLVIRRRGYRLGWFELSPRQRIATRRQELQAFADEVALAHGAAPRDLLSTDNPPSEPH